MMDLTTWRVWRTDPKALLVRAIGRMGLLASALLVLSVLGAWTR
ncbi:MAG: hypothetical protein ACKVQR_14850 [Aquabacterium sp.]